jgi:hypothetical protein
MMAPGDDTSMCVREQPLAAVQAIRPALKYRPAMTINRRVRRADRESARD